MGLTLLNVDLITVGELVENDALGAAQSLGLSVNWMCTFLIVRLLSDGFMPLTDV